MKGGPYHLKKLEYFDQIQTLLIIHCFVLMTQDLTLMTTFDYSYICSQNLVNLIYLPSCYNHFVLVDYELD